MVQIYLQLPILLILLFMGIQDFRYRAISWWAFPLLAVLVLLVNGTFDFVDALVNLCFLSVNYVLVTLVISQKSRRYINLLHAHIGLGDVLMLVCLSLYFTPINFFLFYLFSLLLIVVSSGIYMFIAKPKNHTIPLAGMQGLLLFLCMMAASIYGVQLHTVNWFENYLL